MQKFRKVHLFLSLILVFALLAGCAPAQSTAPTASPNEGASAEGETSSEPVTLTYITWAAGDEQKDQEAAIAKYMEENPNIKINAQFVPYNEYHEKINTLMAANTPPDIYYINDYLATDWGEKGVAADLKPLFEARGINMDETYLPYALFPAKGKIYGIASGVVTINLFYNKEMFAEAGVETPPLDAKNAWTWEQYNEAAKALTTDQNGNHPGDAEFNEKAVRAWGTKNISFWLYYMPFLYSNGATIFTPDGMGLTLNTPEAKEVLNAIKGQMYVEMAAPTGGVAAALPGEPQMFKDKQLAMVISGSWLYPSFMAEGIDVGMAPLPRFKEPKTISIAAANQISAKSKNIDAATDFLIWFTSPETNPLQVKTNYPNLKSWYLPENQSKWLTNGNYNEDAQKVIPQMLSEDVAVISEPLYIKNFGPIMDEVITPALDKFWLNEASLDAVLAEINEKSAGKFQGSTR